MCVIGFLIWHCSHTARVYSSIKGHVIYIYTYIYIYIVGCNWLGASLSPKPEALSGFLSGLWFRVIGYLNTSLNTKPYISVTSNRFC